MWASHRNFGNLEDSLMRDKIVSEIQDLNIQERLLHKLSLILKESEDVCRAQGGVDFIRQGKINKNSDFNIKLLKVWYKT